MGLQKLSDWLNDAVVSKACPLFDFQKTYLIRIKMHNSQKPKSNVCFHNWITKTRSSFYFLPINAQTNISFNLFFWEWTFLIHQSPFDRTFEAWKPIAINQNYNQKEFLNTHHNYILSPWQGFRYRRGRGGNGCQKFWQITNGVEGQIMPPNLLPALPPPPDFQTFIRPCKATLHSE